MIAAAYWAIYIVLIFLVPPQKIAQGHLLSRWLRRAVRLRPFPFRFSQIMVATAARGAIETFTDGTDGLGRALFWTYVIGIFLDDYLSDDDEPWWKRAVGKVKLRMPAPVKLRPIERPTPCIGSPLQ